MSRPDLANLIQRFEDETSTPIGPAAERVMLARARERHAADPGDPLVADLMDVDGRLFQRLIESVLARFERDRAFANWLRIGGRTALEAAMRAELSQMTDGVRR